MSNFDISRLHEREDWTRAQLGKEQGIKIATACDDISRLEGRVEELATEAVFEEVDVFVCGSEKRYRRLTPKVFEIEGKRVELAGVPDPHQPGRYVFSFRGFGLQPLGSEQTKFIVPLSGSGRYREVEVAIEPTLNELAELAVATIRAVFEVGARWIENQTMLSLQESMRATGEQLYALLRQLLPPRLASLIWLFSLAERDGMYLSDPITRHDVLEQLQTSDTTWSQSPVYQLTEFVTRSVDPEKGYASDVIRGGEPLEVDLRGVQYSPEFELAEEAVFQTPRLVGQPLVREGKTLLVAGYPIEVRADVEPVLCGAREEFKAVLESTSSRVRQLRSAIAGKSESSGMVARAGEFVGGVIKGLASI